MMESETGSRWDQLSIETPELVAIEMPVAGLGSRFAAVLIDYLIWTALIILLLILISFVRPTLHKVGEKWATAFVVFFFFLLRWGYFTLFEAFWNGRTPGKRIARIRVIQKTGRGISFFEAMTRNLLRFIDGLPFFYIVGIITVFCTRDSQRLGDLAAGTLVVHERSNPNETPAASSARTITSFFGAAPSPVLEAVHLAPISYGPGIQKLDVRDLEVLEGFFARRLDLTLEMRAALAARIAAGLRAKSGLEIPEGIGTEVFLENVARQLRDLARIG